MGLATLRLFTDNRYDIPLIILHPFFAELGLSASVSLILASESVLELLCLIQRRNFNSKDDINGS